MCRYVAIALLLMLMTACGSDPCACGVPPPDSGAPDSGARDEANDAGDDLGGDFCGNAEPVAVAWEGESPVGSPVDVFGAAERTCMAELRWDGAGFNDRSIDPVAGESTMTTTLELDRDSARWIASQGSTGLAPPCRHLEIDGNVTLETEDGTFRASSEVTLRHAEGQPVFTVRVEQPFAEQEGSLEIELGDNEGAHLSYELDATGATCAGSITLTVTSTMGNAGSASSGELGSWSDSECPLGQEPFDTSEPESAGAMLLETIEEVWGDATFAGRWNDATRTDLSLSLETVAGTICRTTDAFGEVIIPVRATYSTSDGRLQERTVDASVRTLLRADGSATELGFWLSDDQVCDGEDDTLDYTPADCADVSRIAVQLGLNHNAGTNTTDFSDGGLNVYFEPRGGGEPPPNDLLELL